MSATSSPLTTPSQSRSRIWNPSRSVLTCAGWSCESALPFPNDLEVAALDSGPERDADGGGGEAAMTPMGAGLGVQLAWVLAGELGLANLDVPFVKPDLVGDAVGVANLSGAGEAGDSARLKGELRKGEEP